jgi:Amt family ammonium transporter
MTHIDAGDTAWLLICAALVMLMTPGLALFYGGMVQSKQVLSTFMHSFFSLCLVSVQWVVVGYSLAFSPGHGWLGGWCGGLDWAFLRGVDGQPHGTVPHLAFMAYQGMFAAITPALISGAAAERLKFRTYAVFVLLWTTLVYDPLAHWAWAADGWLAKLGALDFAGGTVVHLSSGIAALAVGRALGPRLGYPKVLHPPHNLTMTTLGGGLLWFGWFGFNAGSALAADGLAALALVNTHVAAASGALCWGALEQVRFGRLSMLGLVSGLVAGLVGITPAAGYVGPMAALLIGAATAGVCHLGVRIKEHLGIDDALDAFGIHGVGGAFGALALGLFASRAANPAGVDGLFFGSSALLLKQAWAVGACGLYAWAMTALLLRGLQACMGLRVDPEQEQQGLDISLHGEAGYRLGS